jgi:thiamine-phosphate pyrophosphorylase
VGPLFPTNTKKDVVAPVGLTYLDYVAGNIGLPVVAIGGLTAGNIALAAARGARCFCAVSAIVGAEDIGAAVRELRAALPG